MGDAQDRAEAPCLLTLMRVFSPLTITNVTGLGAAATALFVKESLSAGHSSSPKKDEA